VLQLPVGMGEDFRGVIDLIRMQQISWDESSLGILFTSGPIPADLADQAADYRERLIEAAAEQDDTLMEAYVAEAPIEEPQLLAAIRRATIQLKLVPVLCGAALKNKGIQPLLEAVSQFLPSPADMPPARGMHPDTRDEIACHPRIPIRWPH